MVKGRGARPYTPPIWNPYRSPLCHDAFRGDGGGLAHHHLFGGLHARGPTLPALLRLPFPFYVFHVDARPGTQLCDALHGMGARGALLLPFNRLLV